MRFSVLRPHFLFALILLTLAGLAAAQQPIAIGPDSSSGFGGMANFIDWYNSTSSGGCVAGPNGACVGHAPQGDTYYWTAWLPNASGLPVPTGLPVVATINDWTFICGGNVGLIQMDTFDWANPTASHITLVNCMSSYGANPSATNAPAGWKGKLTSSDAETDGTWKSRAPFSIGGILYLPVERQISQGTPTRHDASMIMSPDSGKHWCNPNTYFNHAGGPGCDASNWDASGDAPKCDAPSSSAACTNAAYLAPTHSSQMWKDMPANVYQWNWINYGFQDGKTPPPGINDGCDPAQYACFMLEDGSVGRVPNNRVLDVSAWQYYACPAITHTYRCPGSDPASWSSSFGNRTPVLAPSGMRVGLEAPLYVKEFGGYILPAIGDKGTFAATMAFMSGPTVQGPWTPIFKDVTNPMRSAFLGSSPGLGYKVLSANPPHVQMTFNSNSYDGGEGSPHIGLWDLVVGKQPPAAGVPHTSDDLYQYISGAAYDFNDLQTPGSFPLSGMAWSFDFLDQGAHSGKTDWPYFLDRGRNSAVIEACNGGTYLSPSLCRSMNPGRGTSMNDYGIVTTNPGYNGHFRSFVSEFSPANESANAPSSLQGNGSYSVVGVFQYNGVTNFHPGGLWSTGAPGANTIVELNQSLGNLILDWGSTFTAHYQYKTNFSLTMGNWYFIAVTVQAQTGACGANCVPSANIWVSNAVTPGLLKDINAGISYTAINGTPASKTPNVSPGPLILGNNANGDASNLTIATTILYDRPLSASEAQLMYQSMRTKMANRGVMLDNPVTVDTTPPTVPTGLTATAPSGIMVKLTWSASSDPSGVTGYHIFRDSSQVGSSAGTFFIDSGLSPLTSYAYRVSAYDPSANESTQSLPVSVTTLSATAPPPPETTVVRSPSFAPRIYPNPWRKDKHASYRNVTMAGLTQNTTIKIFTISGQLVRELHSDGPSTIWDLTNESGEKAAAGVYLVLITDDQGHTSRGKFAIIR